MKKILAFDLDGTLINTTETTFERINKALNEVGLASVPHSSLKQLWGDRIRTVFRHVSVFAKANKRQQKSFLKKSGEILFGAAHEVPVEIISALKNLKQYYFLALITNRSKNGLKKALKIDGKENCDLLELFDFIQNSDDYKYKKPDGKVFRPLIRWAKKQGLKASDISYFGDTIKYDFKATQSSKPKINFIAISSGIHDPKEFLDLGLPEEKIIKSFPEIANYLSGLCNSF